MSPLDAAVAAFGAGFFLGCVACTAIDGFLLRRLKRDLERDGE